jgi:hypothetical protein
VPLLSLHPEGRRFNRRTLSNGVVYGTAETYAFALSAATGEQLWKSPVLTPETPGIALGIAPIVANGIMPEPAGRSGDVAVTNNLAFTTTYSGQLIAFKTTGAIVRQKQMSAGSNASVAIEGNMLVTVADIPLGKGQKPEIVAYKLPT